MAFIFDHMLATLVAMTLAMVLLGTQFRATEAGIEQVSAHAAKTKALTLGTWLEEDITSLGANFGRNRMRFDVPLLHADGMTREWRFYSDSLDANGAITRHVTRYRTEVATEIDMGDGAGLRPLYQLSREVASASVDADGQMAPIGAGAWHLDGLSVATLSSFRIDLVDRRGAVTSDPIQADYIRVEFAMLPEFELSRHFLRELYWTTTLKVRPFWTQPPVGAAPPGT